MQKLIKLFVTATALILLNSCATTTPAPVYPLLEEDSEIAILRLDNQVSTSFWSGAPLLEVELDGFSVTENKDAYGVQYVPEGVLEVKIPMGSHVITHKGRTKANGQTPWYDLISTTFDAEAGKTYTIKFEYAKESLMRIGYAISYQGWEEEVTAQWPYKNIGHSVIGN